MPIQPKQKPPYYKPIASIQQYRANITQLSTNDPTTTIFTNTIGPVTITRNGPGDYRSTETFDRTKTEVLIGQSNNVYDGNIAYAYIDDSSNILQISTIDSITGDEVDDCLDNTTLIITINP